MTRTLWTLATLASHWRRNPLQLTALLTGLALATALWSGVQAINAEARTSYAKAASLLGGAQVDAVRPARGETLAQSVFVDLRRAGHLVSPVVEGSIILDGRRLRIMGIEPISLPAPATPGGLSATGETEGVPAFLRPPWEALAAPETVDLLSENTDLPPRRADKSLPPDLLVMDIGIAQTVLGLEGRITRLLLHPGANLPDAVVDQFGLQRVASGERTAISGLTDSFHLNLSAFAFLAFVVGLLIVRAAVALALEQRLAMFRTLRTCGISARRLTIVVFIEIAAFAVLAGLLGLILGYLIAAALLPDVSGSLRGLYGVSVSGTLSFAPEWVLSGLGMSVAGAAAAAGPALWTVYHLPPLAAARPGAWRAAQSRQFRLGLVAAGVIATFGLMLYLFGTSLAAGFGTMACTLLAAALVLPPVLGGVLALCARIARSAMAEWMIADMRLQLSGLSLALVALMLALAANIGVGTMVGGFRVTFLNWLDQRLAAEVYVRGTDEAQSKAIDDWARQQLEVREVLPGRMADMVLRDQPLQARSAVDLPTYRQGWPLLSAVPDAWDHLFAGDGVMISEQAAIRLTLGLGDLLDLGGAPSRIVAIYADYGNPMGQVMMPMARLVQEYPDARRIGTGLRIDPGGVDAVLSRLRKRFDVPPENVIDQAALKQLSRDTFEKTFLVTGALNVLTLLVASVAIFTSLLTLFDRRIAQLAPVWAIGVARRRLAMLELLKTMLMAALTAVVAIPVGLLLAWLLVSVINVQAFGWRLPLITFPGEWLYLGLLSVAVAAGAALLPILRLARTVPARLLKVFADAR